MKPNTIVGLREAILRAEDIGIVDDYLAVAARCVNMSRKTRNGIRNAAAKRQKELGK